MRSLCRWVPHLAMVLSLVGSTTARADGDELTLGVGMQKIISVPGLQRIAVGDPAIADLKVIGSNQLLLVGAGEGHTTFITWTASGQPRTYRVRVSRTDACDLVISEIGRLVHGMEGIQVRMIGDRVYLDGVAYTPDDLLRVHQITTLYPNVVSLVKTAPVVGDTTGRQIARELEKHGFRNIRVEVVGSTIFLEGSVDSEADVHRAELVAQSMISS